MTPRTKTAPRKYIRAIRTFSIKISLTLFRKRIDCILAAWNNNWKRTKKCRRKKNGIKTKEERHFMSVQLQTTGLLAAKRRQRHVTYDEKEQEVSMRRFAQIESTHLWSSFGYGERIIHSALMECICGMERSSEHFSAATFCLLLRYDDDTGKIFNVCEVAFIRGQFVLQGQQTWHPEAKKVSRRPDSTPRSMTRSNTSMILLDPFNGTTATRAFLCLWPWSPIL